MLAPHAGGTAVLSDGARLRAIVAGSIGNLIEWYDFYLYAFASLSFAGAFFPGTDRTAQLLGTSSIFAIGFFMRPLGSWWFGRRADRHGRRGAMLLSIAMMGLGSAFLAVLPTYASIGVAAPALLLVGRMAQGFSTGGQYGTAATYLSEIAPPARRGFYASFQYVTLIGGQLLAVIVLQLIQFALPAGAMATIGWRIAFATGALAAVAMLILRGAIHESGVAGPPHADAGRLSALLPHWRAFVTVLGLTAGGSLIFYIYSTYMQKYLVNTAHLAPATVDAVMTAVLIPFMLLQPLFGALSDRIGRRANLIAFAALASVTTVPLLGWLGEVRGPFAAFALVLVGLAVNSLYTSVSGLFKAELFPLHLRALGVGLAYGIGNALFGGTAEAIALLFKRQGDEGGFAWYATAVCLVSLATALTIRSPRRQVLDGARPTAHDRVVNDPLKISVRLRCGDDIALGPGKAQVLEAIDRCGSISAAGREIGMSYRRIWLLVDVLNRCWAEPLVQTARGGERGGGTQLTALGRRVLDQYRAMEARVAIAARAKDYPDLLAMLRPEPLPPTTEEKSRPPSSMT